MILQITYDDNELPINIFRWVPKSILEPQHHHHSFEMGLCISGSGLFYFGDQTYRISPGDLFIVNVLENHIAQSDESSPCEFIFINFDPELLEKEEPELLVPFRYYPFHFRNRLTGNDEVLERMRHTIQQLWEEKQQAAPAYRTAIKSLLFSLCVELLRMSKDEIDHTAWLEGVSNYEYVKPILHYIEQNYQRDIDLLQLAQLFHLSQSHISRLILEATGRKFKSHLVTLRIQHAKRLLAGTRASVTDICYECGFQSMATFYRNFKHYVLQTPEDYRHSCAAVYESEVRSAIAP
jgi:AraC-like DNA-binding protein/mannose-6-phosphate isomerase-like protein (cupin superfamily)